MQEAKCAVYLRRRQGDEATDVSDSSDREEVESIGETLFSFVHQLDPTHCADITGELLSSFEYRVLLYSIVCKKQFSMCEFIAFEKE